MAATVSLRVYSGTNAATESSAGVSGISFFGSTATQADLNTLAARQGDPINVGSNSASKHLRLKIDSGIINSIGNIKFWIEGSPTSNVALRAKLAQGTGGASPGTGGTTPATTALTGDADAYSYTSGAKGTWDSASYTSNGHVTKEMILQLQPNGSAAAGNWSQSTLKYSYDES